MLDGATPDGWQLLTLEEVSDERARSMSEPWVKMKHGLFYCPNNCGYTGIRDLAGRYSRDDAEAETNCEGVSAMPLSMAPEFSGACFDDLARKHLAGQRDALRDQLKALGVEPCA